MDPQLATRLVPLLLAPLIAFGLYRRFKRSFGRQPLAPPRMILRIGVLACVAVMLLVATPRTADELTAAAAGVVLGAVVAALGLRWTRYETTPEGVFYVPNGWIGAGVTALFLARLVGRLVSLQAHTAGGRGASAQPDALQHSPLTLGLFFLLAGYYVSYYAGVLLHARNAKALAGPPKGATPDGAPDRPA